MKYCFRIVAKCNFKLIFEVCAIGRLFLKMRDRVFYLVKFWMDLGTMFLIAFYLSGDWKRGFLEFFCLRRI